jgi:3-polyprenyl-4-hydroxybenzoate decarboxylase
MPDCLPVAPVSQSNERIWAIVACPVSVKALAGIADAAPRGAIARKGADVFREGVFVQTIEIVVFTKGGAV